MDKQGIILDLGYSGTRGFATCVIYRIEGEQTYAYSEYYKSRREAETKGLCMCFEILEGRSKK